MVVRPCFELAPGRLWHCARLCSGEYERRGMLPEQVCAWLWQVVPSQGRNRSSVDPPPLFLPRLPHGLHRSISSSRVHSALLGHEATDTRFAYAPVS